MTSSTGGRAEFGSRRDAYQIERRRRRVIVKALATDEGTETLVNVGSLQFADQTVTVSRL